MINKEIVSTKSNLPFTLPLCITASPNRQGRLDLPVKFLAEEPGHYPCEIVMRGADDVRVFKIECTVNPEGSTAELHFAAPVHQNVTQEIPLVSRKQSGIMRLPDKAVKTLHLSFC